MVLNKSEVKMVMEQIEKKLQGQKSITIMEHDNKPAWNVLRELWNDKRKQFVWNNCTYNMQYNPAHETIGNRSSTPEFSISKFTKKETFDVDELMSKKEIRVRDWTGADAAKMCGLVTDVVPLESLKDVTSIVTIIMTNTNLNVMIQRHDTGDVTIWVDNKRFTQR
jgi:hypothetical protein